MSTLATYQTLLSEKLATTSTTFFTAQMRLNAINYALNDLYNQYDVPELMKVGTISSGTSYSSGPLISDFPSDYGRMVKLWWTDTDGVNNELTYITPDQFDDLDYTDTGAYFWTEDWDTHATAGRKLFYAPNTLLASGTLHTRYVKKIVALAVDTDDSGINTSWDDAVAYVAASILLENAKDNKADTMRAMGSRAASQAYGGQKNRGGVKGYARLRSVYEKYSILDNTHPN